MRVLMLFSSLLVLCLSCVTQQPNPPVDFSKLSQAELEHELQAIFKKEWGVYSNTAIELFYFEDCIAETVKRIAKSKSKSGISARYYFDKYYPEESQARKPISPCTPISGDTLEIVMNQAISQVDKSLKQINQVPSSKNIYMNRNKDKVLVVLTYSRGSALSQLKYAMFISKIASGWKLSYGELFGKS